MRKFTFLGFVLIVAVAWAASPTPTSVVTFNKDVAPILNRNCANCHRPGEIGPMSLLSYKEARPWAKSIREKVVAREMPPWHADPNHGQFSNDRRLGEKDIATLVAWVDGGMKEGDAKDLPPTPKFTEGWNIGKPDVVLTMPDEYSVPAEGVVDYQYMTVETKFTEDHWIQAAEIRAGNRGVVHHIIVFVQDPPGTKREPAGVQMKLVGGAADTLPRPQIRQAAAGEPRKVGEPRQAGAGGGNRGGGAGGGWVLIGTAPGDSGGEMKPGTAKLVKAGSKLIFQIHYTPNGTASKDRSSVGLIFAKTPPEYEVKTMGVTNNRFVIPAGEANYRVESAAVFSEDSLVYSVFPHMHVRGKAFEYRLIYPDGHSEIVASMPKYDFNWQGSYRFKTPLEVPKGSRLECVAYFDNSKGNKANPDADKDVRWGDQTWEEMMIGWMDYSVKSQRISKTVGE
jgi:hypothetical protein